MVAKRPGYQIPTLKVTQTILRDPQELYQALVDYSNDIQAFLQKFVSYFNQNNATYDAEINAIDTTLAGLAWGAISLGASGYVTLPSGLIIQLMGAASANNPGVSNLLPKAFPNNIWGAVANSQSSPVGIEAALTDKSHVTLTTPAAGVMTCSMFAWGN